MHSRPKKDSYASLENPILLIQSDWFPSYEPQQKTEQHPAINLHLSDCFSICFLVYYILKCRTTHWSNPCPSSRSSRHIIMHTSVAWWFVCCRSKIRHLVTEPNTKASLHVDTHKLYCSQWIRTWSFLFPEFHVLLAWFNMQFSPPISRCLFTICHSTVFSKRAPLKFGYGISSCQQTNQLWEVDLQAQHALQSDSIWTCRRCPFSRVSSAQQQSPARASCVCVEIRKFHNQLLLLLTAKIHSLSRDSTRAQAWTFSQGGYQMLGFLTWDALVEGMKNLKGIVGCIGAQCVGYLPQLHPEKIWRMHFNWCNLTGSFLRECQDGTSTEAEARQQKLVIVS